MKKPAAAAVMKVQKRKSLLKPKANKLVNKGTLRSALVTSLKEQTGRKDLNFQSAPVAADKAMNSVPMEQRAGYPLVIKPGSVHPKDWHSSDGVRVMVDFTRAKWMPDDWGQGVKCTKPCHRDNLKGGGGTLTCFVAPDGKVFYHKHLAEAHHGTPFTEKGGFNGQVRLARLQAQQAVQLARAQIKDTKSNGPQLIGTDKDETLFRLLSKRERANLPSKDALHFCVVSARRASKAEGVCDIWMVQTQFLEAGITPTWYVDEASLADYKAIGLNAVVGGKLTEARNKALRDAYKMGKACVQVSDDISAWEYRDGKLATDRSFDALNEAHAEARRIIVSPVAAARFILAKMRGADAPQPKLGGVYMLGSCSRTFGSDEFSRHNFILGDFFVADKSPVRFDEEMRLKEDYDFTAAHIKAHGSVMRCNRMTLNVKHYANSGGACSNRDSKGLEERRNIDILFRKWPGCFILNWKRENEVIMRWKTDKGEAREEDDDAEEDGDAGATNRRKRQESRKLQARGRLAARRKPGVQKTSLKGGKSAASAAKGKYPPNAIIVRTGKEEPKNPYIKERLKKVVGRTVGSVLGTRRVRDTKGNPCFYRGMDLAYDIAKGQLKLKLRGSRGSRA